MLDMHTLDLAMLPSVSFETPRQLPQITGVYCCLSATCTALYIGSSWNIRRRWYQQEYQGPLRDLACMSIAWIVCSLDEMLLLETALIDRFHPLLNTRVPVHNGSRSPMLKRQCLTCGTVFFLPSATLSGSHIGVYCSQACYAIKQRAFKRTVSCQQCGAPVKTAQGKLIRGLGKYCSVACANVATIAQNIQRSQQQMWKKINRCPHEPFCLYCCWTWAGAHDKDGYPKYGSTRLHRRIWEIHNQQKLPRHDRTYVIRHLCSNAGCVNPWHLTKGTYKENTADARIAGRLSRGVRHYRAKFTEQDIVTIRQLHAQGSRTKVLAQRFQCSESAIQHIVKNRCWTHVILA